jgi:hypothetical protein
MTDSPHTSPRSAQEQTLGAVTSGPGQDIYGPVPVHPIGQGWSPDATQGVRRPSSTQSPYGQASTPSLNNDELVLVTNNQLMTDTSEFGSLVGALTKVMSPNIQTNLVTYDANQHLLLGLQGICPICNVTTQDPALCANCGAFGHPVCIGIELFQNHYFCHSCFSQMVHQYALIDDIRRRREWEQMLSQQLINLRERARNALGVSTSIGIAVGGVAATAAGAAIAVVQGLVQGAAGAATGTGLRALPPIPVPDVSASRPLSLRRSNSTGDLVSVLAGTCPKCDGGDRRAAHTYRGTCRGLPASVYFGPRGLPAIPIAEVQPTSTELARRMQDTGPTGQAFITPDRALTDLVAPVPTSPPRALMPLSPQQALMPPSSFDSANSHTNQSFYGLRTESPLIQETQTPEAGAPAAQSTGHVGNPHQAFTAPEISDQLLLVATTNEELSSTVNKLQAAVNNLEIQVSDRQFQLQWFNDNWIPVRTQQFVIGSGTPTTSPRFETGQQSNDALSGWYGDGSHTVPPRVADLSTSWQDGRSGPDANHQAGAEETRLSREVLSQLSAQSQGQPRTDVTSGRPETIAAHGGQNITEVLGGTTNAVVLPTDSDLFTCLAGTQPSCTSIPQGSTGGRETGGAQSFAPPTQSGCQALAIPVGNANVPAPPGLAAPETSLVAPSTQELGFIMRAIQSFLSELPKIELGDISTRATRLLSWKANFE